ncbi:hypothetical protein [Actinomadura livida]|uniref:Uncharacterized protein n=1 Tax=Actinomadura livida TaxID=79909 RepID=A0A7W7IFM6_9ACTN|nr:MULTISPECIES: hypothetical protein [Actinomadura]MBB4776229.1 hypothetical protein [Actinomadura catellatispora]GGU14580.1 hypothetical protein GCM10010208_44320 [Actinomadura livida]
MTGTMRAPRTRGLLSGTLLVLLGLWGGLLPFAGPYFGFGFAPDETWVYDTDRLQLSIAPAAAVVLGGLIVLAGANRVFAMFGAWLAALGGAWFAVGHTVASLWDASGVGAPLGTGEGQRIAEQLAGFTGLGVVIAFLAGLALGRFAVVGAREAARESAEAQEAERPGSGTTQPLVYGRYARENPPGPASSPPGYGDQPVAGEHRYDR